MYSLTLKFDQLPKPLNKALRTNRFKSNRVNKEWDMIVSHEVSRMEMTPPSPLTKAKIYICRHSYRTLDYDGLVGSMKPVVDALVTCGVLSNDTWNVTGQWIVDQKFRPKVDGPLLEVFVRED